MPGLKQTKHTVICKFCQQKFIKEDEPYYEASPRRYAHKVCYEEQSKLHPTLYPPKTIIDPTDQTNCCYCLKPLLKSENNYVMAPGADRYAHKACAEGPHTDIQQLEDYVCDKYNLHMMSPRIKQQIRDFQQDYHYTVSGILGTLIYFYEIQKHSLKAGYEGIGIVPYVYSEAKEYFTQIQRGKENNKNKNFEEYKPKTIEIVIPPPKRKIKKKDLFSFLEGDIDGE